MHRIIGIFIIWMLCFGGASRDFDGNDDINFGTDSAFIPTNWTVSAWVIIDGTASADYIASVWEQSDSKWGFAVNGTPDWTVFIRNSADTAQTSLPALTTPTTGVWHYIAGSFTPGTPSGDFYLNGVEDEDTFDDQGAGYSPDSNVDLELGVLNSTPSTFGYLDGRLSNFQFHNVILNLTEINEMMWKPETIRRGIVIHAPLWGNASPENDLSGNGHTGTVTGSASSADGPPVMFGGGLPL